MLLRYLFTILLLFNVEFYILNEGFSSVLLASAEDEFDDFPTESLSPKNSVASPDDSQNSNEGIGNSLLEKDLLSIPVDIKESENPDYHNTTTFGRMSYM